MPSDLRNAAKTRLWGSFFPGVGKTWYDNQYLCLPGVGSDASTGTYHSSGFVGLPIAAKPESRSRSLVRERQKLCNGSSGIVDSSEKNLQQWLRSLLTQKDSHRRLTKILKKLYAGFLLAAFHYSCNNRIEILFE